MYDGVCYWWFQAVEVILERVQGVLFGDVDRRRVFCLLCVFFFFQAEDGIRSLVRSRGLGDVYKGRNIN